VCVCVCDDVMVLQEVGNTLQHAATYCNTLQHAATYCNALQHTLSCEVGTLACVHSYMCVYVSMCVRECVSCYPAIFPIMVAFAHLHSYIRTCVRSYLFVQRCVDLIVSLCASCHVTILSSRDGGD